ncbi:MAG: flagellar biosynthetic protein FliR, partial [Verrucomicrobia bacterium]|nr:flagellar biosynthetic protein FliR [Verrucomicrobiota bacterium]
MTSLSATDNYLSLLLALPNLQPVTVLSLFFLTLARILPIIALAPFLGSRNISMIIRMMFGISLVAIFLPNNLFLAKGQLPFDVTFIFLLIKEILIGFVIGFFAAIPFYIAQMAGGLIDHQRGAASLQVTDPTTQTQTGPIGQLYNFVLIALFFSLGGPFLFLDGVANSYQLIPVDGWFSPTLFNWHTPLGKTIIGLFSTVMNLSIQLSAPALIGILLTDMFLGIA